MPDVPSGDAEHEIVIGFPGPSASGDLSAQPVGASRVSAADAEASFVEKRRFVRVPKELEFTLRRGEAILHARLVDLSEGGLRCVVSPEEEFEPHDLLHAAIDLGDAQLEVRGRISWELMLDGSTEVGIQFHNLSESDAQQIRSHVFALQLSQRPPRVRHGHHGHRHGSRRRR